jgi:hypothetical protein
LDIHRTDTPLAVWSMIGFPKKGYSVLGINNRGLDTMQVDLNTTSRLAELFDNKSEPVARIRRLEIAVLYASVFSSSAGCYKFAVEIPEPILKKMFGIVMLGVSLKMILGK